ncbi:MAG: alpha/beta fold hydrolase [Planctomycetes bacterium]|nr:alpha/beta fold hydrolase [Planctomycetota bacterium]
MNNRKLYSGVFLIIVLLLFQSVSIQAQIDEGIDGIWSGTLKVPGAELRIALTISKSDTGEYSATMVSVDQGSGEIPMDEVKYENHNLIIKNTQIGIVFEGRIDVNTKTFTCEFRQGPGKFPVIFHKVDKLPAISRPQEPKRPYPYNEEQVKYENQNAGIEIAGTLTYPKTGGPFPVVILLTGSGPQNRDEEVFGHKPFLILSDYLTRQGIAVLRADDRGVGGTTGVFKGSTTVDFADDALAGIRYLQSRREINANQIGLVGHSEGGMMAPIAASKSQDVSFIVLIAGPGIRLDDIVLFQKELKWKKAGMSEEDLKLHRSWHKNVADIIIKDISDDAAADEIRALYSNLTKDEKSRLNKTPESLEGEINSVVEPWRRYGYRYDPESVLLKVKCPVLAINGSKDMQVVAGENLNAIEKALKAGGNTNYMIKELQGLNHLLQTAATGEESEYIKIEETMSPAAMKIIADWIKEQVKQM